MSSKDEVVQVLRAALLGAMGYAPAMAEDHRAWFLWLIDPKCRDCGGVGSVGGQSTVTGCVACGGTSTDEGSGLAPMPAPPLWFTSDLKNTVALQAMQRSMTT